MAIRFEKAFGLKADTLCRMQTAYELAQAREHEADRDGGLGEWKMEFLRDYSNDQNAAWSYGNTVLYKMCKDKSRHDNVKVAASKFWLIGRAYAASPQRGSGESIVGPKEDFFEWLVEPFATSNWLDDKISELNKENHFSPQSLAKILETHHSFEAELRKRLGERNYEGKERTERAQTSFCSKYLHFHRPDHFPIFDSYVNSAVSREFPRERFKDKDWFGNYNDKYERFCRLIFKFRKKESTLETLRGVDIKLYKNQREHLQKKWEEKRVFK